MRGSRRRHIIIVAAALCLLTPGVAHAFSKAIWGDVYRSGVSQFPLYRQLGVSIYQSQLRWDTVAVRRPRKPTDPRDGAYRWPADLDQAVSQAQRFHVRVLLQITGAPGWANGNHGWSWAPRRPSDFAAFAAAASRRYPSVHLWMIWGEPTRAGNFNPISRASPGARLRRAQKRAPHLYARILDAAYHALKHVSRRNKVVGGCTYTTGLIDALQWLQNLRLPSGKPPHMDIYAHNPFSYKPPRFDGRPSPLGEVQFSDLPRLNRWIHRYLHRRLPLFLSEWTIPTAPDREFNFWVEPAVAAKWVRTALGLSRRSRWIYALGWIHVYDDPPYSYGGLLTAQGARKPTFDAFARG